MNRSLRVLIAEDEKETQDYFSEAVTRLGHQVVAVVSDGRQLIEQCLALRPDLVLADIRMPQVDGIQAAHTVNAQLPIPFILLSAHHGPEELNHASADYVVGYLVKPVNEPNLKTTIAVGMNRFERYHALAQEATALRQSLEDRKVIERAKGIVMTRLQVNEEEAFRRLRRRASDHNMKLADVARQIVSAEEIFFQLERERHGSV